MSLGLLASVAIFVFGDGAQADPAASRAVVASCQQALSESQCTSGRDETEAVPRLDTPAEQAAPQRAEVTFSAQQVHVLLSYVDDTGTSHRLERTLTFDSSDQSGQRQVAAGLLVAALSAAASASSGSGASTHATPAPPVEPKGPDTVDASKSRPVHAWSWALDIGGGVGMGLAPSTPRYEVTLGTTIRYARRWGIFFDLRAARSFVDDPRIFELTIAVGPSLELLRSSDPRLPQPVQLWLGAQGLCALTRISQVSNSEDRRTSARGGARLVLGIAPQLSRLRPWLTVDVSAFTPRVELLENGKQFSQLANWVLGAHIGLRYDTIFPR